MNAYLNKPLLVICGPTATGKTNIALSIANIYKGDLISADSRQLYKLMDIGTGKDIPKHAKKKTLTQKFPEQDIIMYQINSTNIWGYDLFDPDQSISISRYAHIIRPIVEKVWQQDRLPILVGGSGLYIESITKPPQTSHIPPDKQLRLSLDHKSIQEMQAMLQSKNKSKWDQMTHSDKNNKRRLIRAIEIASNTSVVPAPKPISTNILYIGLFLSLPKIKVQIRSRVHDRIALGFDTEIDHLLHRNTNLSPHASSAIGYKEWIAYKNDQISQEQAIDEWIRREVQYAKRQITWFKKKSYINWVDVSISGWHKHVERLVKTWYANN